jgi:tetratricopeptide (TPR) repeat protein
MKGLALVIVLGVVSAIVLGDVVYLHSGKSYEGKVTRRGDKVLVELTYGQIELAAEDVRQIVKMAPRPDAQAPPAPAPEEEESRAFSAGRATLPDTLAFLFMRRLETTTAGVESYEIRREAKRWQDAAHDRLRKGGAGWLSPRDFQSARKAYARHLEDAEELAKQMQRLDEDDPSEQVERRRLATAAAAKTLDAAQSWGDPLLRSFLIGVAYYQGENFGASVTAFRRCAREGPLVAAFHQGHGMALAKVGRPLEAVEAFTRMLRLRPDSAEALELLRNGMQDVPGTETRREAYQQAKELSDQYPAVLERRSRARRDGLRWMLPGDVEQGRYSPLPLPKYDRLVFRQAVGVATGEQSLLLDAGVLEGSAEAFVRVGEDDYVPASAMRRSRSRRGQELPPLRTVSAPDLQFEPASLPSSDDAIERQTVTLSAVGIYAEMGAEIARLDATLHPGDAPGKTRVTPGLPAGDGAAPVLSHSGQLLGFVGGKTDVTVLGGGPDRFIAAGELEPLLERTRRSTRTRSRYGSVRRIGSPRQTEGVVFVVCGIHCETLD